MSVNKREKLLFVISEDWYFMSHRLPLALGAIEAGMEVSLATNISGNVNISELEAKGIRIYRWKLNRGSTNVFSEIAALYRLHRIFKKAKPSIVHNVAIKPVLYGSLLARLHRNVSVVNALGGLGFLFSQAAATGTRGVLRSLVLWGFRRLLSRKTNLLILQNPDDRELLTTNAGICETQIRMIRGAGVNVQEFHPADAPTGIPVVILPARMLVDKGIREYVGAARILKSEGIKARFLLVGGVDKCNPASISNDELAGWVSEGVIEWLGRRDDMAEIYRSCAIVCLPSYREGLPKSLLEAASCGRAIVSTDVPGCREIVKHNKNGLLVPPRDVQALADSLKILLCDSVLREQMGAYGRQMVVNDFSEETVVKETLEVYRSMATISKNSEFEATADAMVIEP